MTSDPAFPDGFERRLVDALQPVRYSVVANALYALMRTGVHADLLRSPATVEDLAAGNGLDARRLDGLLIYLRNEGYVARRSGGRFALTPAGRELEDFEPWYTLLVGGYAQTFAQLSETLREGAHFAGRDSAEVGRGSCGISRYDAIPLVRALLSDARVRPDRLIDLGCGNGDFLLALLAEFPAAAGIGVDPDAGNTTAAVQLAEAAGMSARTDFVTATGTEYMAGFDEPDHGGDCYVASFVLQEILQQDGEEALVVMLKTLFERAPGARLAVVEVDHRPEDSAVMQHGLANAYYNPYYLIHRVTEQRLETKEFWQDLFRRAGVRTASWRTADPAVDSTGLAFGCLLEADR
ncbi:2-ketoarginine methyltransferase [Streptomyces sp. JH002]|uniref:2-ketoarginine methyltransferase n=1 Tax=Streptomyces sp. JH002 TaxID=2763259 RepID=UPI003D801ABE